MLIGTRESKTLMDVKCDAGSGLECSIRPTMGMAWPSDIFSSGTFRSKPAILEWEGGDEKMGEVLRVRDEYEKRRRKCGALKLTSTLDGACINGNIHQQLLSSLQRDLTLVILLCSS